METKNKLQSNTMIIYSMRVATELIKLGHVVLTTIPNPAYEGYISWIFIVDDTLMLDLEKLKGGARFGK